MIILDTSAVVALAAGRRALDTLAVDMTASGDRLPLLVPALGLAQAEGPPRTPWPWGRLSYLASSTGSSRRAGFRAPGAPGRPVPGDPGSLPQHNHRGAAGRMGMAQVWMRLLVPSWWSACSSSNQ